MSVIIWLIILALLAYGLGYLLRPVKDKATFKLLFLPGTGPSTLGRWLGCKLTKTPIQNMNLFGPGPPLTHAEPKYKYLGPAVICLMPFLVSFGLFSYVEYSFDVHNIKAHAVVTQSTPSMETLQTIPGSIIRFAKESVSILTSVHWTSVQTWIYFYLTVSLLMGLAPRAPDLKWLLLSLLSIGLPLWLLGQTGMWLEGGGSGWSFEKFYYVVIPTSLSSAIRLIILSAIGSAVVVGLITLFSKASGTKEAQ